MPLFDDVDFVSGGSLRFRLFCIHEVASCILPFIVGIVVEEEACVNVVGPRCRGTAWFLFTM